MNHQPYREWIELGIASELSAQERHELDEHLKECAECHAVQGEMQSLHATMLRTSRVQVTDELLHEARRQFRVALREERSSVTLWQRISETVDALFAPPLKLALGGSFMLAVGFVVGYLMFSSPTSTTGTGFASQMSSETELSRGEAQIMNVKFVDAEPGDDGIVEFSFDAITSIEVKGSINDPGVQRVLVRALENEENPGTRLRAVSAITSPMVNIQLGKQDKQVKEALINTMKYDENPAVRKEALKALGKLAFDDDIKQGLLYVLSNDKNQSMRIEAINSLSEVRDVLKPSDDTLLNILRQKMESDNNGYVRQRARLVLQEVQQ